MTDKTAKLKAEWQQLKADKKKAQDELRKAKFEKPQDLEKINNAKANVAKADDALQQQRIREKEHNSNSIADAKNKYKNGDSDKETTDNVNDSVKTDNTSDNNTSSDNTDNTDNNNNSDTDNTSADNTSVDNSSSSIDNNDADSTSTNSRNASDNNSSDSASGGNMTKKKTNSKLNLPYTFYQKAVSGLTSKTKGNLFDAAADTAEQQQNNLQQDKEKRNMEAKASQQIVNRNAYDEATKVSAMQDDIRNKNQGIGNSTGAGNSAFMKRQYSAPDVQYQEQRQDQQRNTANQKRSEADTAQQNATEMQGVAENNKILSKDYNTDINKANSLSKGVENNIETDISASASEETSDEQQTEQQPEQPADEPQAEQPEKYGAKWQNVLNVMTYGNDPTSQWSKPEGKDGGAARRYIESLGLEPLSESDVASLSNGFDSSEEELQNLMSKARPDFYKSWAENSNRIGSDGTQINRGMEGDDVIDKTEVSDVNVKNLQRCLSDFRMKCIREDLENDGKISPANFIWLARLSGGKFNHNGRDYDFFNDNDWDNDSDDTVLKGYADYIRNYLYTYKPEAVNIDPNIDPNEEHIGPMAQDIEKVNPACIKETADGIKTVDTQRLSMMNAGAIGDLARELRELNDRLKSLGI